MASERFVLKHFYYGQLVQDGKPKGELRVVAKTHGLEDSTIQEALSVGALPTMDDDKQGAWAILRGKRTLPFVMVTSHQAENGHRMLHYILLPSDLMRQLGGNLKLLRPLIDPKIPIHSTPGNIVNPVVIADLIAPTQEQEVDDILDFMMFTKNRMENIEALLSSIVQNVPVYVINAPKTPDDRELFIVGLLALLPPSVRYAVTFATSTEEKTVLDAQVRFLDEGTPPEDVLVFDWADGKVSGKQEKDDYSRFITSQLRLDVEAVIRQTRQLTAIANWRMRHTRARLAPALAYAAQRVSIDDAVLNRQPVEAEEVSRILATDPTLSDELRVEYARHLMSFSMALGELEHAEPLGIMIGSNSDLADTAYEMLGQALRNGAAGDIFDLMSKWLDSPMGPKGERWMTLTHECAKIYLNDIIDSGDLDEVQLFLRDVDRTASSVRGNKLLPSLLKITMPVAVMNEGLARTIFALGCKYLNHAELWTMLSNPSFVKLLPEATYDFVAAVRSSQTADRLLLAAASSFNSAQRLIMVRLVEIVLQQRLPALVDTLVLKQLVKVALADWGRQYSITLQLVVNSLTTETMMRQRSDEDNRLVLELLLAMGSYKELARHMLEQSRILYVGDRQAAFAAMVGEVFNDAPIVKEELPKALDALHEGGIRSLPLLLAYIGSVASHDPSEISNAIADEATDMISASPRLLDVLPMDAIITLVQFQFKRRNEPGLLLAIWFLSIVAARYGERTSGAIAKIYQNLTLTPQLREARLDMLRRYIRYMSRTDARTVADNLARLLGKEVAEALEATYALKLLTDDADIETYIHKLHVLAEFLNDPAEAYASKNVPSQGAILNDLESMPGGLLKEDNLLMSKQLIAAGLSACHLSEEHDNRRGSDSESYIQKLLQGEVDPQSAVEVLWVMGGYLSDGTRHKLKLNTSRQNPHPLPRRNASRIKEEVETANNLLGSMSAALSDGSRPLTAAAVRGEIASIWHTLSMSAQSDLRYGLAQDLQRVAELIPIVASKSDIRALEDTGLGRRLEENRQRPRNVIEFYRFVAGYFLQRTK